MFCHPLISRFFFQLSWFSGPLHYLDVEFCILEVTSIIDNTKINNQDTLTPNSIPLAPIIQISYIMAMPYFRTPSMFFFEGFNIINIFGWYKLICSKFQIGKKEKIRKLPLYYEIFIGKYIKIVIWPLRIIWSIICNRSILDTF